ncbi:uncharacterized protein LOC142578319 [Dermacentor variabilis]|uniref:uncharacterized protein LOC142578319 n=1 Tax=Dermacentor variabilis TaxID=34621 RepID=UPI003F5BD47D
MYELQNVTLRFVGLTMRPSLGVSVVDGKVIFDGLAWYIIQCLQQALRFKTQLQTTDEQIWSSRRSTGEWGGPLGMLERNESDITAHPVIPTADRLTVGTPLPAYMYSNPRYYAGAPNAYMTSVFGYLMSFDLEVWLGLLLCWPLVSAFISLIQAARSPLGFRDTITDNLFDLLGIMMFEGKKDAVSAPHDTRLERVRLAGRTRLKQQGCRCSHNVVIQKIYVRSDLPHVAMECHCHTIKWRCVRSPWLAV